MATSGVTERHWFPRHQPQTLQIAVALLYWNAALYLLFGLLGGGLARLILVLVAVEVVGGYGVANERKWGYWAAVGAAVLPFVLLFDGFGGGLLSLLFEIALVALLLHPQSRSYYKVWFR